MRSCRAHGAAAGVWLGAAVLALACHESAAAVFRSRVPEITRLPRDGSGGVVDVDVVTVQGGGVPFPDVLAVQACAGLINRQPDVGGAAFVILRGQSDWDWLSVTRQEGWVGSVRNVSVPEFLRKCMASPLVKGYVRYNYTSQHLVIPQIITIFGVTDAVPLEDGSPYIGDAPLAFDALAALGTNSSLRNATRFIFERFVNSTSTLAFMDPGFTGASSDPFSPSLTRDPVPNLVDFIVRERLFNMYMVEACIPLTEDYALMEEVATRNPWPRPVPVFGYNDAFPLGGDLFEAETTCVKAHDMGQVASDSTSNLAFFAIERPIDTPLPQPAPLAPAFNASKTYLALTVGDGDNLSFLESSRRSWMLDRVGRCRGGRGCFPLLWSLSPHLLQVAPSWARWFYAQAAATGRDWFVLPPSGHLYAYPSLMPPAAQQAFVAATEDDARLMSTSATVAWEVALSWQGAIDNYFPRYGAKGVVTGFFPVNVPFMLPVLPFLDGEFFKVLGNESNVVLFRPREWRGTDASRAPPLSGKEYLTAAQMAAEINGHPPGTATQIYVTSDGGANLDTIYSLAALLGEHVEVVDHASLVSMALASHAASSRASRG